MFASLVFAAATVAAASGAPTTTPPAAAPAAQANNADYNKVICRTEETTGTRLGAVRVCMTKAQWDDRAAEASSFAEGQQNRGYQH